MTIDLSGPLYASLEKSKKEFEKAKREGDIALAKTKARECAHYCKLLAKNVPNYSKEYLTRAEEWEQKAEQVRNRPVVEQTSGEETLSDETNQFKSYIETLIEKPKVTWESIGGLEKVKGLMKETIVIAGLKKPDSIKPWKGILLFGPPGTGKTLLAAAAAGSLNVTFINVKASDLLSKFYGESSKYISALYTVARERAPTIVFIDEFDALSLSRGSDVSEASRKMLSSLLVELDGFLDKTSKKFILTLAATNTPWSMDKAVLSRFPRRINVPLPDVEACKEIIKLHMKDLDISKLDLVGLAEKCVEKMFSGREIAALCQSASTNMVREENKDLLQLSHLSFDELKKRDLKIRPLEINDFHRAFEDVKSPLTRLSIEEYEKWGKDFGE
jgi:SpoVK/Ycf46/Vps4 family AAA+-type ATPase